MANLARGPGTSLTGDAPAIADNAYFAQRATFPGIGGNLTAPGTPWILYGGSLAGAQTAFSVKTYGDILYGGIASSGTIEAVLAYPQWYVSLACPVMPISDVSVTFRYDPIQKFGPSDCIASINAIIDKMDQLVSSNNTGAVQQLKAIFGLEALSDNRDFAMTIAFPRTFFMSSPPTQYGMPS